MEKINTLAGEIVRSCEACKFSMQAEMNPQTLQRVRRCFRFPPHITSLPSPQGVAQATAFPQVGDAQWCFEFAPKPVKLSL